MLVGAGLEHWSWVAAVGVGIVTSLTSQPEETVVEPGSGSARGQLDFSWAFWIRKNLGSDGTVGGRGLAAAGYK